MNYNIVLICGESGAGKSMSLRDIREPEGVLYLNFESNKSLPFRNGVRFQSVSITDPEDIFEILDEAEQDDNIHSVVFDTVTFMMDMYESVHVIGKPNTQAAWGNYQQFWLKLMQQYVASSSKGFYFLAHAYPRENEETGERKTQVRVKGQLQQRGLEAFFNIVVYAKVISVKQLEKEQPTSTPYLTITDKERSRGQKYVFQIQKTPKTLHETIRGPEDLVDENGEIIYIDNNADVLMDLINQYYYPE